MRPILKKLMIIIAFVLGSAVAGSMVKIDGSFRAINPLMEVLLKNSTSWYTQPLLVSNMDDSNGVYVVVPVPPIGDCFVAVRIDTITGAQTASNVTINPNSHFRPFAPAPVQAEVHGVHFRRPAIYLIKFPDNGKGPGVHLVDSASGRLDIVLGTHSKHRPLLTRIVFNSSSISEILSLVSIDPNGRWIAALLHDSNGWSLNLFSNPRPSAAPSTN